MSTIETDLIIKAISAGFDKVKGDITGIGKSSEKTAIELAAASNKAQNLENKIRELGAAVAKGEKSFNAAEKELKQYKQALGDIPESSTRAVKSFGAMQVALGNLASDALQAVGRAMADFVKGSIAVASSAQETASLIDNSLGPAADSFREKIGAMADATKRSAIELEKGASTIIAMTRSMGFGQEAAADFSATMAQIATDLGSFFNQSTEQVFQDIQAALGGSSETMQKYGIDVRETTLKNVALEMGLIKQGETLDRVTRAQVLQAEVLRQASDAMGDAERTADSYENTQRGLEAAVLDLQASIGTALIPAMTEAATWFTKVADRVQIAIGALGEYADKTGALIDSNIESAESMEDLVIAGQKLRQTYLDLGPGGRALTGTNDEMEAGFRRTIEAIAVQSHSMVQYEDAIKAVIGESDLLIGSYGVLDGEVTEFTRSVYDSVKAEQIAEIRSGRYSDALEVLARMGRNAAHGQEDLGDEIGLTAPEMEDATKAAYEAEGAFLDLGYGATRLAGHYIDLMVNTKELTQMELDQIAVLEELEQRTADYYQASLPAIESTGSFEEQLYNAAVAAGASAEELALLGSGLGLYSEEAVEAALKSAAIKIKIDDLATAYANGEISISDMRDELGRFIGVLNGDFKQAADEGAQNISEVGNSALDAKLGIEGTTEAALAFVDGGPYVADFDASTGVASAKIAALSDEVTNLLNKLAGPGGPEPEGGTTSGGGSTGGGGGTTGGTGTTGGGAGGGYQGPGLAKGGSGIVPPGFPNDSYPLWLSSGEGYNVTPAGAMPSGGGGMTVNVIVQQPIGGNPYVAGRVIANQVANRFGVRG
jgi:hypothetical protein